MTSDLIEHAFIACGDFTRYGTEHPTNCLRWQVNDRDAVDTLLHELIWNHVDVGGLHGILYDALLGARFNIATGCPQQQTWGREDHV